MNRNVYVTKTLLFDLPLSQKRRRKEETFPNQSEPTTYQWEETWQEFQKFPLKKIVGAVINQQ